MSISLLLLGACKDDKSASDKETDKPTAAAEQTAEEPTGGKEAEKTTFAVTVNEAVRVAEVPGEPPIKALPGNEIVCVRYQMSGSGIMVDPPKLEGASGKSYSYDQHASKAYANDQHPRHVLMAPIEGETSFGMCYQVKADDAAAELSVVASPSKGEPVKTSVTAEELPQ